jgi:hypothetical protein
MKTFNCICGIEHASKGISLKSTCICGEQLAPQFLEANLEEVVNNVRMKILESFTNEALLNELLRRGLLEKLEEQ